MLFGSGDHIQEDFYDGILLEFLQKKEWFLSRIHENRQQQPLNLKKKSSTRLKIHTFESHTSVLFFLLVTTLSTSTGYFPEILQNDKK